MYVGGCFPGVGLPETNEYVKYDIHILNKFPINVIIFYN